MITPQLTLPQTRVQDADLVKRIHFANLQSRLPLAWPASLDTPPSPKKQYRSHYRCPGYEKLSDPAAWEQYSLFEM